MFFYHLPRHHVSAMLIKFFKWHLLNIGLPVIAALVTYFFAQINTPSKVVDDVLTKAFSGGDNLIVASIMFVILYYEMDIFETQPKAKWVIWVIETAKCFFIVLCIILAAFFGAFKFYSFTVATENTLNYAGAVVSIGALFFASACGTFVKVCLVINESVGGNK